MSAFTILTPPAVLIASTAIPVHGHGHDCCDRHSTYRGFRT